MLKLGLTFFACFYSLLICVYALFKTEKKMNSRKVTIIASCPQNRTDRTFSQLFHHKDMKLSNAYRKFFILKSH